MSKIQTALTAAGGEFARPTKYNVLINTPGNVSGDYGQNVDILCKNVTIPEITLEPIDLTFKGHTVKYPGRVNQSQTVSCTFYLDENYKIREMFTNWISIMDPRYYGARNENSQDIKEKAYGNMVVFASDYSERNKVMTFTFEDLYPISVSELEYNTSDKDNIMEITVTFAFYRYLHDGTFKDRMDNMDNFLDIFGTSAVAGAVNNILGNGGGGTSDFNFGDIIGGLGIASGVKSFISKGIGSISSAIGGLF